MDIEEHYEDTSHHFLVSKYQFLVSKHKTVPGHSPPNPDAFRMQRVVTLMLLHHPVLFHEPLTIITMEVTDNP